MISYRVHDLTATPVRLVLSEDTYSMWSSERVREEVIRDAKHIADVTMTTVWIVAPEGNEPLEKVDQ